MDELSILSLHGQSIHSHYDVHPFPGPVHLWWGRPIVDRERPRNLFGVLDRQPNADQMFRAGGLISETGVLAERDDLHRMIAKLIDRIRDEPPFARTDPRAAGNPRIPSGYTYLLQLIAHDMVDSVVSFTDGGSPRPENARAAPLLLDTLYGRGPDQAQQAYAFDAVQHFLGKAPRTHMRLAPRAAAPPPGSRYCPFRDVARSVPNSADAPHHTDVMLADPRNDAHALLSQLAVVFKLLHNLVLSLVESATASISVAPRELAYRRFQCARQAVTLIYRNIIEKDVLEKILDDRIYKYYVVDGHARCDSGQTVPLEFSFGAFRFGHSMVRDSYDVNSVSKEQALTGALLSSSQQRPDKLPVQPNWFVDWDLFFSDGESASRNLSQFIDLRFAGGLYQGDTKVPMLDRPGLVQRDFISSCYAGTLSARGLCRELRSRGFDAWVQDFDEWERQLAGWLRHGVHFPSGDADGARLARDPPLPFFLLFEAMSGGGQHLGPIGSIVVAETILGAFRRNPLGVEGAGNRLQDRLAACGRVFFENTPLGQSVSTTLSQIGEIERMPQLLEYMHRHGCFG
jgi:hypothetical protein